jgi:hypothetical protein
MRLASPGSYALWKPCIRCGAEALGWDRIAGKSYCPACQESIVQGDGEPLIETTLRRPCSACHTMGAVTLQLFPLKSSRPLELELCPEHLREFLGRKLGSAAYAELRRQLAGLGINVHDVFLLHEAFYDTHGHALQPAAEPDLSGY